MSEATKKCRKCQEDIPLKAKVCSKCKAKQGNWFQRHIILTVILGIILFAIINGAMDGDKKSSTNSDSNTSNKTTTNVDAPKPSPIIIKTDTLVDALKENALNASNTYKDKYVEVTGRLSNIDSSGKYISLSPINDDFSFTSIMCYITPEQQSIVAGLKKDNLVTVVGTITDVGEVMGYSLKVESFK